MDGVPEMGGIYGFGPTERNGLSNREGMETAGSRDLQSYGDLTGHLDDRLTFGNEGLCAEGVLSHCLVQCMLWTAKGNRCFHSPKFLWRDAFLASPATGRFSSLR